MATEGELRSHSLEAGDQVRALQDSVAELKAEVIFCNNFLPVLLLGKKHKLSKFWVTFLVAQTLK